MKTETDFIFQISGKADLHFYIQVRGVDLKEAEEKALELSVDAAQGYILESNPAVTFTPEIASFKVEKCVTTRRDILADLVDVERRLDEIYDSYDMKRERTYIKGVLDRAIEWLKAEPL